jgi:hypothetical protein
MFIFRRIGYASSLTLEKMVCSPSLHTQVCFPAPDVPAGFSWLNVWFARLPLRAQAFIRHAFIGRFARFLDFIMVY